MSKTVELDAAITANKTAIDNATALLAKLAAGIQGGLGGAGGVTTDADVQAAIDSINANTSALQASVDANTPTA